MKLVENEWERGKKSPLRARQECRAQEGQDGEAALRVSAQQEEGTRAGVRREKKLPPNQHMALNPPRKQGTDEQLTPSRADALLLRACFPHANLGTACPSWSSANVLHVLSLHTHTVMVRIFLLLQPHPSSSAPSSFSCPPKSAQLLLGGFTVLSPSKLPLGFKPGPLEKEFDGTSM